ncbi:MAG: glycyl-radical enzyme activating protein [Clostridiales bacterium]|nr:glycyl-radical enzyme activating protein [Clostridiales bacterium]
MTRTDLIRVTDIQRYSVHDGPGIRTVVFFKGCPLRCAWCQNPETQAPESELALFPDRCIGCGECIRVCPSGAIGAAEDGPSTGREPSPGAAEDGPSTGQGRCTEAAEEGPSTGREPSPGAAEEGLSSDWGLRTDRGLCTACGACVQVCYAGARCIYGKPMTVADVLEEAVRDRVFFDNSGGGVTLSGGEPLFQATAAAKLLRQLKVFGIHTAVETCGYGDGDDFSHILAHTDCVLFDIKHMDSAKHLEFTGVDNALILENLDRAAGSNADLVIRLPLIPGVNDDDENLRQTAGLAQKVGAKEVHLLGFHQAGRSKWQGLGRDYRFAALGGAAPEKLDAAKAIFEAVGVGACIGGGGAG